MLKLDLLPAHYAIARLNRKVIIMAIPVLVGVALLWLLLLLNMNGTINRTKSGLESTKVQADKVRDTQGKTAKREGELKPIADRINFVQAADQSGGQFWDRFHEVNKYIHERALISSLSISGSTVTFTAGLENTEDAARFILNMVRCPYITSFSISGLTVAGGAVMSSAGVSPTGGAAPAGAPGMPGAEAGAPPGMGPGGPGMPPPGMGPGGPGGPGMGPGAPGGAAPGGAAAAGPITFNVTCTLKQAIVVPTPPAAGGGAAAAGPGGAGPGGPPGAPGMGGPGGPPGGGGASKGKSKSDDEDSGDSGTKPKIGKAGGDGGGGDE